MRSSNMNSGVPEPVLSTEAHCGIRVESVLRIRPLFRKEREDPILLEPLPSSRNGPETVVLNPFHPSLTSPLAGSSLRNRADSDSTSNNVPIEYHFNHVLPDTTNQDKLYYTLGHPIASDTMKSLKTAPSSRSNGKKSKGHLLVCMGVANSGKTYTCFGGTTIPKRRTAQDGLVPRLIDSLFSQSKHNASSSTKGFAIQMSMVQVIQPEGGKGIDSNACKVYDLLAFARTKVTDTSPKTKSNTTGVRSMAARFERAIPSPGGRKTPNCKTEDIRIELDFENPKPTVENVRDATQAREVLQDGLIASGKLSKGNSNFHLCVTMQPVLDGTKYGEKIVVLDMAGIEKEKGSSSSRKSDNVSSLNQAASVAVLRCLRVMTHNVNTASGTGNSIDVTCSDDEVSEISSVSQAKDPVKRHLKPVPFRQHKITMLLIPLFTRSSSVKVKILLAAYPGHNDLQQKRMLLQDIELLHGSSLVPPLSSVVETGLNKSESRATSSTPDEGEASSFSSFDNNRTANAIKCQPKAYKVEPVVGPRFQAPKGSQPNASKLSRHYSGVASKALRVEKIESRLDIKTFHAEQQVQPSAPALPDLLTPREVVTDFPGVNILLSVDKNRESQHIPFCGRPTNPRQESNPTTHVSASDENDLLRAHRDCNWQGYTDVTSKKESSTNSYGTMRNPLERSSLENSTPCQTQEYSMKRDGPGDSHHFQDELTTTPNCNPYSQENSDNVVAVTNRCTMQNQQRKDEEIKKLEKRLKESLQEKQSLERLCAQLEKENAELKKDARDAGRKVLQRKWTNQDEEEFLASRRMRREAQNLIKAPIQEHLEKVNYIYEIKNQWCMTNKQHFSLHFPDQFQRAPVLNIRDMAKREVESEKNEIDEPLAIRQTRSEDLDCVNGARLSSCFAKPRTSLASSQQKPVEPPSGLFALKRLATGRASKY